MKSDIGEKQDFINITRVQINGSHLTNTDLLPFLIKLKNKNIRTDIQVSQKQFMESNPLLRGLSDAELVDEIEVSLLDLNDNKFINTLSDFSNCVLRVD